MRLKVLGPWVSAPIRAGKAGAASSYLVVDKDTHVLLDCGSGAHSLLQEMNAIPELNAIVISHMHHDHYLDLFPLANTLVKHSLRVKLYVPSGDGPSLLGQIADLLYPGDGRFGKAFELIEYGGEDELTVGELRFTFRETIHPAVCYAARMTNGSRTLVYSADSEYFPELGRFAEGADLLLCEATSLHEHHGHMTGEQAGRIAAEAKAGRLVLTHLRHDENVNEQIRLEARKVYSGVVDLAAAGAEYRL